MIKTEFKEIIQIYHAVAQLKPEDIFGQGSNLIAINQIEDGRTASPGWVGSNYPEGKILFMGINPGGGTSSYTIPRPDDVKLYNYLRSFRVAKQPDEIEHTFSELNGYWISIQRQHNIWRLLSALLDAAKIDENKAAYLNLVPFRTREDKSPNASSLKQAWQCASCKQIAVLKPKRIFLLGKKVTDAFTKLAAKVPDCEIIPVHRTIGDSYLSDQAKEVISQLKGAS